MSKPQLFNPKTVVHAVANIDGGSRGNPGPAGYGVRIECNGTIIELKEALGIATNNIAEYRGLLSALQWSVEKGIRSLHIRSDSELLVKQMQGKYRVRNAKLQGLHGEATVLAKKIGQVEYEHIPRESNKEADRLANKAMDEFSLTNTE